MRFGSFDQIIKSTLRRVWQSAALPGTHRNSEAATLALHLWALLDLLVCGVGVAHLFFFLEEVCGWGEVMHVGGCRLNRVD